jgi:DNA-binding Lrp family transcriptional regulator
LEVVWMYAAIVLINTDIGKVPDVAEALAEMEHVEQVYSVAGEYDIVAIIRVPQFEQMSELVSAHIARVPGVARTQTLTAFRSYPASLMEGMWRIGLEEEPA